MKKVYISVVMTAFFFGTMEVALKMASSGLDSFQLTFLRFLIGGVILLPLAVIEIRKNKVKLDKRDFAYLLILGIVCIPVSMMLFQLGVEDSNASTAAVLFCVNPLFTMVLAHFFAGESMNRNKGFAFILGLAGIVIMMKPWDIQAGNTIQGMFFTLTGALFFSIYTVMGKKSIEKIGLIAQTSISFLLGTAVLLIIMLIVGSPVTAGISGNIPLVIYIGVCVTGLGYLFYFIAIKYSDATTGSVAFFIKPVIAPVIAAVILGEVIQMNTYIGIAFILGASFINMRESR